MTPLEKALEAFATQAATPKGALQLAVIAAGLALGWLVARILRRRVPEKPVWAFGAGGFHRVAFPLAALALIWGAGLALRKLQATPFVDLAIALLVAFALIRLAVYMLRSILPEGAFLRGSERTIAIAMWVGVALHIVGILPEVWEALDDIAFTAGKQRISLLLVLQGLASVAVTLAVSLWLAGLIERQVLAAERLEMSTRVVIAKLLRAVAAFVAILVALPLVGIDVTALSVFGGALGVGLGLGLQKIASNYVSGYIILLERSVRIGDLVTVDNRQGTVREIASRFTVIGGLDGNEYDPAQRDPHHAGGHQPLRRRPQGAGEGEGVGGLRLRCRPGLRPPARHRAPPAARARGPRARLLRSRPSGTTASPSSWWPGSRTRTRERPARAGRSSRTSWRPSAPRASRFPSRSARSAFPVRRPPR